MTQFTDQFAITNWVIVPTGQTPPRPEDQKWLMILSGVAFCNFQGTSNADWRRDSFRLAIDLTGPIQFTGRSAQVGRELRFQVEQFTPYSTINAVYDAQQSVDAGYAVDSYRPIFTTRGAFTEIFDTLSSRLNPSAPNSAAAASTACNVAGNSSRGTVNEISAFDPAPTF